MPSRHLDAQILDDLLALGGNDLRDLLLSDLARCASRIRSARIRAVALTGNDADLGLAVLHELRGIALTLGAVGLSEYCLETETCLRTGTDTTVPAKFASIAAACDALGAAIGDYRIDQE